MARAFGRIRLGAAPLMGNCQEPWMKVLGFGGDALVVDGGFGAVLPSRT